MSYILDALRKADAERERGSVPGLHTQPVPAASAESPAMRRGVPVSWVAGGTAVLVAGALAWAWGGRGSDAPHEPPRPVDTPPVAMAAPPVVAQPAPAPVAAVPEPAAPAPAAPAPVAPPPAPGPAPVAAAPRAVTPAPVRAPTPAPARHAAAKPAPATTAAPAASAASASEARVYSVNELPADIRRDWPPLSIGGSIYSDTPASRFLIINGQIYHEGDKIKNGLSLEQIKLKAAVLLYKGYRVGITY
jgi:general secretion pathway protein B